MPNADFADITIVLDRSGSMNPVAEETITGVNHFIDDQRKAPGRAALTLTQFDDQYQVDYSAKSLAEVPALTRETYQPRGWTALLDAIGRTINETGRRLESMSESDRPGRVIFVIMTDGLENYSKEFDRGKINGMISHQRDVYGWQFLFLGANQDAIQTGAGIGIPQAAAMTYAHTGLGVVHGLQATSDAVRNYRSGAVRSAGYAQDDRDQQAAWLAGKKVKAKT